MRKLLAVLAVALVLPTMSFADLFGRTFVSPELSTEVMLEGRIMSEDWENEGWLGEATRFIISHKKAIYVCLVMKFSDKYHCRVASPVSKKELKKYNNNNSPSINNSPNIIGTFCPEGYAPNKIGGDCVKNKE